MAVQRINSIIKKQQHQIPETREGRSNNEQSSFTTKVPARLNNMGVKLLTSGRHEEALKTFAKALKVTKAFMARVSTARNTPQVITIDDERDDGASQPARRSQKKTKRFPAHDGLFSFSRPILVAEEECDYTEGRACLLKLSKNIILNMAVVHNEKSLLRKRNNNKNKEQSKEISELEMAKDLKKAVALHELACRMQAREKAELKNVRERANILKSNSKGQIHLILDKAQMSAGPIHLVLGNAPMAKQTFQQRRKRSVIHKKTVHFS